MRCEDVKDKLQGRDRKRGTCPQQNIN